MTKVDEGLYKFLKAYAKWAYEDGAPEGKPFTRKFGLCYNCEAYFEDSLHKLHKALFDDFGANAYPFSPPAYESGKRTKTQHLDPNRKAWVLGKIKEYEDQ